MSSLQRPHGEVRSVVALKPGVGDHTPEKSADHELGSRRRAAIDPCLSGFTALRPSTVDPCRSPRTSAWCVKVGAQLIAGRVAGSPNGCLSATTSPCARSA
jgi:hypothetical protein